MGLCFTIASWQDWKSREISDKIWMAMVIIGVPLILLEFNVRSIDNLWIMFTAISITFSTILGLTLYKIDMFGGADAKALIALSILIPTLPENLTIKLNTHPITPISTFNNSIIISTTPAIYLIIKNSIKIVRGEKIFQGLENENILKKILAIATGYRIPLEKIKNEKYKYPIEEIIVEENSIKRRLNIKIGASMGEEKLGEIIKLFEEGKIHGHIWVTPALPLIVFMSIGVVITLLYGDIIFKQILLMRMR